MGITHLNARTLVSKHYSYIATQFKTTKDSYNFRILHFCDKVYERQRAREREI